MRFPVSSAALNLTEQKPAIVQSATRNCAWYKNEIKRLALEVTKNAKEYRQAVANFKTSGTWKEEYKTWGDASRDVLDLTPQRSNTLIRELTENYCEVSECPHSDSQDKKEQKALSQVEQAREEEPEKPAVHSADEKPREEAKPQNNGHVKATKPPMDVSGCVIPQRLLAIRERRQELQDAAYWASKLKCLFEGLQTQDDVLFRHLKASGNLQTFMNGAATMHYTISKCLPDVVCPECGAKSDSCQYCFGSGWISEVTWNREWVKSNDRLKGAEVAKRAKNL